jgi:hypothetical protein
MPICSGFIKEYNVNKSITEHEHSLDHVLEEAFMSGSVRGSPREMILR